MDTLGRRKANDTIGHYRCLPKREPGYVSQVSLGTNISEGIFFGKKVVFHPSEIGFV